MVEKPRVRRYKSLLDSKKLFSSAYISKAISSSSNKVFWFWFHWCMCALLLSTGNTFTIVGGLWGTYIFTQFRFFHSFIYLFYFLCLICSFYLLLQDLKCCAHTSHIQVLAFKVYTKMVSKTGQNRFTKQELKTLRSCASRCWKYYEFQRHSYRDLST